MLAFPALAGRFFLPLGLPGHTITWVDVILFHISETLRTGLIDHCPIQGFPAGSDSKDSACNAADLGSIPGSGRSPGEGNDNPLQNSCLENPMEALRGEIYAGSQGTIENANSKWQDIQDLFSFRNNPVSSYKVSLNVKTQFQRSKYSVFYEWAFLNEILASIGIYNILFIKKLVLNWIQLCVIRVWELMPGKITKGNLWNLIICRYLRSKMSCYQNIHIEVVGYCSGVGEKG